MPENTPPQLNNLEQFITEKFTAFFKKKSASDKKSGKKPFPFKKRGGKSAGKKPLSNNQKEKLDMNKNGKIDATDFKMLRKK
jgi:hypothetical protein